MILYAVVGFAAYLLQAEVKGTADATLACLEHVW
jgi:hypothetical protein